LRLGGVLAADYLQKGSVIFDSEISFKDPGFQLGDGNDLRIRVENSDEVIVENRLGNEITFRITVTEATDERDVAVMNRTGIVPGVTNSYNLGAADNKWANVYATGFNGNLVAADSTTAYNAATKVFTGSLTGNVVAADSTVLVNSATKTFLGTLGTVSTPALVIGNVQGNVTGTAGTATLLGTYSPSIAIPADPDKTSVAVRNSSGNISAVEFNGIADQAKQLLVDGTYRSAALTATGNTVAARDASGDIYASLFQGTATAARYADLAEKYLADKEYEPGTVVCICQHGDHEVEASSAGKRALGVVSTNPAFMMNKDLEGGTYIALKGRVPVKVYGRVKKGDELIAGNEGNAIAGEGKVFAIALESNDNPSVKLVEAVVL
jgi:hypothetical protein